MKVSVIILLIVLSSGDSGVAGSKQVIPGPPVLKIHAFFNQDHYAAGDTAFFSIRLFSPAMETLDGAQIIHLTLTDEKGEAVLQQNFRIVDGRGASQLIFPPAISSRVYRLRISVAGVNDPESYYTRSFSITRHNEIRIIAPPAILFPESGSVISGIENRVVIRLPAPENNASGVLMIDGKDSITFRFDGCGVATFNLLGKLNARCQVRLISSNYGGDYVLPAAVADGLALKYLGRDNGDFSFLIRAPEKSTWLNQDLKFIVKAGQKILFPVLLSELRQRGAQRILVPSSKMPRGLVELLVTADGSSVSGRWLLDAREDASGEVSVESRYLNRQKVLVKLNVRDVYGQPTAGIFSVRVANALISKDFACNDGRSEPLENATSGVRGQKTSYSDQMTFDQKLMLRGRLYFKDNSNPVPDSTHLALFFQKNLVGYDLYTGHNGNFSFRVPFDFYGHDKASAIAEYQGKELENIRLEIDTELFNPSPALSFSEGSNLDWYGDYQVKRQKTDKAFQYVSATDSMPFTPHNPNDAIEKKIGQADIAVKLSDYLILPSMADIIREIIPSLALRTTDGRTDLKLYLLYSPDKGFSPDANPVIFIDGVMTKDVNYFINMNPSDIVSIKLIRKISKLQKLGFFGKNGAILITTKNASLAGELSRDYPEVIGFTGGLPFINKSHDGKSRARYPDFRSCLYWNPALGTDSQGNATFEFFTSDDIGDFAIQIQGDTGDGRVLSIEKKISVGKKQVR